MVMAKPKITRFFDNTDLAERIHISRGQMRGIQAVHKFGAVPSMSNGVTGTVWDKPDTKYPWATWATPGVLTVNTTTANGSVSTLDSGLSITIVGLDENFLEQTETITISGSTGTGTKTFARVYRAFTSATNQTRFVVSRNGTEVLRVSIEKAQTLMAIYTVPAGRRGYLVQGTASIQSGADATVDMFIRYGGTGAFRIGHTLEISGTGGQYQYDFTIPTELPERTDIDVRASMRSNNARLTAAFDVILLDY